MFGRKSIAKTTDELGKELAQFAEGFPATSQGQYGAMVDGVETITTRGSRLAKRFREATKALEGNKTLEAVAVRRALRDMGLIGSLSSMREGLAPIIELGPEFSPKAYEVACDLKDSIGEYLQACEG